MIGFHAFCQALRQLDRSLFAIELLVRAESGLDCTELIQSRINTDGYAEIPRGTFLVHGPLPGPIIGAGKDLTILKVVGEGG